MFWYVKYHHVVITVWRFCHSALPLVDNRFHLHGQSGRHTLCLPLD